MNRKETQNALNIAVTACRAAGDLMKRHAGRTKRVNEAVQHDIKLELDVRCQKRIEKILLAGLPESHVLGEEGTRGREEGSLRWVVDPIDGTVNYAYGIPHACVSIALQARSEDGLETVLGAVFDPFCDELWTAVRGQGARLNGKRIQVSQRTRLKEAIVAVGFAKYEWSLAAMLPVFGQLVHQVRKIRIMGSAALSLTYVACGRFDAYTESGIRLWDIAAGGLIVEEAGGRFWTHPIQGREESYEMTASNGKLHRRIRALYPTERMHAPNH